MLAVDYRLTQSVAKFLTHIRKLDTHAEIKKKTMVETETRSFKIQSHLFFTMMKSMSKNIILIVKIVFFLEGGVVWCLEGERN